MSPCSWDHIFILEQRMSGVWPLRILECANIGRHIQSFLLIFCTGRIVTDAHSAYATSTAGYNQTFQQIARFSTPGLPLGKAAISYLRTVIVTAAVYWGFSSSLSALSLTFQHRAGVSPYTSPFGFAETCVFGKQSVEPLSFDPRLLRK